MAAFAEGAPCWADAALPDLEAGKRFYGELFGWTFGDRATGAARLRRWPSATAEPVAALTAKPRRPDAHRLERLLRHGRRGGDRRRGSRAAGGQVIIGPEPVGPRSARWRWPSTPAARVFGLWQARLQHRLRGAATQPGAFCWTEVLHPGRRRRSTPSTRAVFGYRGTSRSAGPAATSTTRCGRRPSEPDAVYAIGGRLTSWTPALSRTSCPSHFRIYFAVADCDAAAADGRAQLGGRVTDRAAGHRPYGRIAAVADDQGAAFAVIDPCRRRP